MKAHSFTEDCGIASCNTALLDQAGVLEIVLSYVGPGHWFFVAAVSSLWRKSYAEMERVQVHAGKTLYGAQYFLCFPKMTLYSSVLTSPTRVRLAHAGGLPCTSYKFAEAAVKHADLPTLLAAHELGMRLTYSLAAVLSKTAAAQQSLPMQRWLCTQTQQLQLAAEADAHAAAAGGSVGVLTQLHQQGASSCWSPAQVLNNAAACGSVALTAWAAQQPGVVLSAATMCAAAEKGHTAVCQYLLSQQCPWSAQACNRAAAGGHTSTLRWLRSNGCPWTVGAVCTAAAQGGSVELLVYLQGQRLLATAAQLTNVLNIAGAYSQLAAAQWLRQQGAQWPAVLRCGKYKQWQGDVLAWARAEGCTSLVAL
jgi:hypothetical protein